MISLPIENDDLDTLALILFTARDQSRRKAKRLLRDAGGEGTAAELDDLLAAIDCHEQRDEIIRRADNLRAADDRAREILNRGTVDPGGLHPAWLIAEAIDDLRTFVIHFCPGGAHSFVAEVFDAIAHAPAEHETWLMDEEQVLSNFLWLDGDRPEAHVIKDLRAEARRQLRQYDANCEAWKERHDG